MSTHTFRRLLSVWKAMTLVLTVAAVVVLFAFPPAPAVTRAMSPTVESDPPAIKQVDTAAAEPSPSNESDTRERVDIDDPKEAKSKNAIDAPAAPVRPATKQNLDIRVSNLQLSYMTNDARARDVLEKYARNVEQCCATLSLPGKVEGQVVLDFEPHWRRGGVPATAIQRVSAGLPEGVVECFESRMPKTLGAEPEAGRAGHVHAEYAIASVATAGP